MTHAINCNVYHHAPTQAYYLKSTLQECILIWERAQEERKRAGKQWGETQKGEKYWNQK